ncbi:LytTR family DNA-binding domain-containing protein [Tsuneonella suprasediminis]|nr:LytTR family DNA-binding domain-containing protein [Tsuneonella suprasediminis]
MAVLRASDGFDGTGNATGPLTGNRDCTNAHCISQAGLRWCRLYSWRSMNGTGILADILPDRGRLAREIALMGAAALAMALLAPFGMDAMSFGARLFVWLVFAIGGYLCFRPVVAGGIALSGHTGLPLWLGLALATVLASFPTTLIVAGTLYGWQLGEMRLDRLAALYTNVVVVGGLFTALQVLLRRNSPVAEESVSPCDRDRGTAHADMEASPSLPVREEAPSPDPARLIFDKLPPALGENVLYLENEDHYLRVHTDRGDALILMRMGDAAEALRGIDGARVHRGWWVARRAVSGTTRQGRAIRLQLVDGREVPVARSMVEELRLAGWF